MQTGKNPEPRKSYRKTDNFNYQLGEYTNLPKPQLNLNPLFFEVINKRKSERVFTKLTLEMLGSLLWHSAKAKKVFIAETGNILSHRASASAGAIHPIDILISLPVTMESRLLYYYNPFLHKLASLNVNRVELDNFFKNINNCLSIENGLLIWFVADCSRTAVKYKNSESLIWRDAGALIMTVQLVATALNLNSCAVGTLGEPFLSKCFDNKLFSAGGLLLG